MQSRNKGTGGWKQSAAELAKNRDAIAKLARSGDAQKLMALLDQQGGVKEAAGAAAGGDPAQLLSMLGQLMESPQGAELIGRIGSQAKEAGLRD